mmetsp:Transcript_2741/g.8586  ORF Transcript_2741/g.8586 Transcript_2741/m.8586 type:complete len:316 (-) Transcript_2741:1484-2431(-)
MASVDSELQTLEAEYASSRTAKTLTALLRHYREHGYRQPRRVEHLCSLLTGAKLTTVHSSSSSSMSEEIVAVGGNEALLSPTVREQLFLSLLDLGHLERARTELVRLERQFPGSSRVDRLRAMHMEACGNFSAAEEIYKKLIHADPTDQKSMKRFVSMLEARGNLGAAARSLVDYLKTFMADAEAWHHLATLYLRMGDFEEAQFCYEELILHQPQNPFLYCRYAEILYTLGGGSNLKLARQNFCYCLELTQQQHKPPLLRALYGLVMTCQMQVSLGTSNSSSVSTYQSTCDRICEIYATTNPEMQAVVREAFGAK